MCGIFKTGLNWPLNVWTNWKEYFLLEQFSPLAEWMDPQSTFTEGLFKSFKRQTLPWSKKTGLQSTEMEKERQDLYIWQGLYRCIARLIWAGHDDQTPVCRTWYYRRSGDKKTELLCSGETEAPFTSWVIKLKGQHKVYGPVLCLFVLTMRSTLWKNPVQVYEI